MADTPSKWGSSNAVSAIVLRLKFLTLRLARLQAAAKADRAVAVMRAMVPTETPHG